MSVESITRLLNNLPADTPVPTPRTERLPMRIHPTVQTALTFLVFWTLFVAGFTYSGATDGKKAAGNTPPTTALAASQSADPKP